MASVKKSAKKPTKKNVVRNSKKEKVSNLEHNTNGALMRMAQNSALLSRSMLASRLGVQFDGQRDLYQTFGYVRMPEFQDYMNMYIRHGLAQRIIRKFADSTWNKTPVLLDGDARSDALDQDATPFLNEWDTLTKRLGITQVMRQADIMCQIGRYSVLFLGASGNDYSKPVKKKEGLFFIAAYDESQAMIQSLIEDPKNEKFGMPQLYSILFNANEIGLTFPGGNLVHYSRIIHLSEDRLGSRIYGTPRLLAPLNRLMDLEKTTGGGAEAAWLATWGGMLFTAQDDVEIPDETSEEGRYMDEQMQKFFNRLQRYAVLKGVDVQNFGVSQVNIEGIYGTLKTDLAGTVGIPQRILFGSERGELASTQDRHEWNSTIDARRTNFAEPEVLRPFVDWCIQYGVLSPPKSGEYNIEWFPVYSMTKEEQASYAAALANGASTITGGTPENAMDITEWRNAAGLAPRKQEETFDEDDFLSEMDEKDPESLGAFFREREAQVSGGSGNGQVTSQHGDIQE